MSDSQSAPLPESLASELSARCRRAQVNLDALTSQLCVYDLSSIVTFGSEAAREISQCSDAVLNGIRKGQAGDAGPLLSALGGVMEQFNADDLRESPRKGLFRFGKKPLTQDQLLEKYRAISNDLDQVYIQLKKYESEVQACNQGIQTVYEAQVCCYQNLVNYILAGEQGLREIQAHIKTMDAESAQSPGNTALKMDLDTVRQAHTALERRVQDLRTAEIVALQSIPMLQMVQTSNSGLIQKIDSAFLVTLPIFKKTLGQAVARKRQRLQAQAMEALDRRTRDALGQQRTVAQAGAASNEAQMEALTQSWKTIVAGIEETRALQRAAEVRQAADEAKLKGSLG